MLCVVAGSPAWPLECPLKDTLEAELCRAMRAPGLETRENAQAEISRDWRASYKDSIDRKGVNKGRPDSATNVTPTLWIVRWVIRVAILPGESPEG